MIDAQHVLRAPRTRSQRIKPWEQVNAGRQVLVLLCGVKRNAADIIVY